MRNLFPDIVPALGPALLLALAASLGSPWTWVAILSLTVGVHVADIFRRGSRPATAASADFPLWLGWVHLALLALAVHAAGNPHLSVLDKLLVLTGCGLWCGQTGFAAAHELIHRPRRMDRRMGVTIYASLLFGHHASAHRLVHHVHAATDRDPNSARRGESVWRFLPRAWFDSYQAGYVAEDRRRRRMPHPPVHPYRIYTALALMTLTAAVLLGGIWGAIGLVGVAGLAQVQLLLTDFVQHYGLRRQILPDGTAEPIGPEHAWNAPPGWSERMLLNATRHSDHHVAPCKRYDALDLDPERMPTLPHSLPVMAAVALVPGLWRRIMDPRLEQWAPAPRPKSSPRPRKMAAPAIAAVRMAGLGGHDLPDFGHEMAHPALALGNRPAPGASRTDERR